MPNGLADTPEESDLALVWIAPIDVGFAHGNEPALPGPGLAAVVGILEGILAEGVYPLPGVRGGGDHFAHVLRVVCVEDVDAPVCGQIGHDPGGLGTVGRLDINKRAPGRPGIGTAARHDVLSLVALMSYPCCHCAQPGSVRQFHNIRLVTITLRGDFFSGRDIDSVWLLVDCVGDGV